MTRFVGWLSVAMWCVSPWLVHGEEPKPAVPPKGNPLQNLLQKIIPPQAADPDAADEMDERAPKDRRQTESLKKIAAAIEQQDWPNVVEQLHRLLAEKEDSAGRLGASTWGSVREQALRLMLRLPDEAQQAFRERWSAEARRQLETIKESNRVSDLVPIAVQFLLTDAGHEAADRLACWHFDRGEFALATRWFRRVEDALAIRATSRVWQLKAAFAAARAGDKKLAERWQRGTAESPDETQELGGAPVRVAEWWRTRPTETPPREPLTEWPMTFGLASRSGIPAGGVPLMWSRWKQPLTGNQPLQQRIELLIDDCRDQTIATIPVSQPVFVEGLIALRTLAGVQVWEAATGKLLWSASDERPAEKSLSPNPSGINVQINININFGQRAGWGAFGEVNRAAERVDLDNSALANLLFGNGNFGPLSSDGQQLFFVEDGLLMSNPAELSNGPGGRWSGATRRGADSNRLVSYGLRSGRPLWSVGGAETDDAFQAPLSGTYFFGPPVADGDELFVIGERDSEVRLFCLDRESGSPLWSQLLAVAAESIARDLGRRQTTAQPALSDGVVICPTTVGWLTAVDRRSRELQWTYRYSTPTPNRRRNPGQSATVLPVWSDRWRPSVPVISGDSVVFSPMETEDQNRRQGSLICLSLRDGTRRWVRAREQNWIALNGVHDGRVLLLGTRRAAALSLANGEVLWEQVLNNNDGAPSGLGMILGDRWQVPMGGDQLWTLAVKTGTVESKQPVPVDFQLGNLHPYRGGVVSVHPTGVTFLEQRDEVLAEISRRRRTSSSDAVATLMEAAMLRLDRKPSEAWKLLATLSEQELSAESRSKFRQQAREVLFELIEPRPHKHSEELLRLVEFLDSPEGRARWERLMFEGLRGRKEWLAAYRWLQEVSKKPATADVVLSEPPERSVRRDVWLAGAFADLRHEASPEVQSQIELNGASVIPSEPNEFVRGELSLLALTDSADRSEAARAWLRLVELYRARELAHDANLAAIRLRTFGEAEVSEGVTAAKWADQEISAGRLGVTTQTRLPDWGHLKFRLERMPRDVRYNETFQDCTPPDFSWPYFTGERFRFEQSLYPVNSQRFAVTHADDQQLVWSQPLRGLPTALSANVVSRTIGHQMLVLHRDVLHLLSPVDQRVIWTRPLGSRGLRDVESNVIQRQIPQPLQTFGQAGSDVTPLDRDRRRGPLPLCSPRFVVSRSRHMLTVLDAATGERQWELQDLPTDAAITATDDLLAITSVRRPDVQLLRTADGATVLFDEELQRALPLVIRVVDSDWILIRQEGESTQRIIERWNPSRRQSKWHQPVAANDHFSWLDATTLAILKPDSSLHTLDTSTGQLLKLGNQPAGNFGQHQRQVLADRDRVYLILTAPANQGVNSELPSLPINGTIIAFDRPAEGELWRQSVQNKLLVLDQWANSPVLMFAHTTWESRTGNTTQSRHLLLLDKRTGKTLLDEKIPQQTGAERGITINLAQPEIQILGIERLRLIGSPM